MEWTGDEILRLIEAYKKHPVLWNSNNMDYYNKVKKSDAWLDISIKLGRFAEECKRKTISLLSSYRREKSRVKKALGSRKGPYKSHWFAFEALRFLDDREKPQADLDTEAANEENAESDAASNNQPTKDVPNGSIALADPHPPKRRRTDGETTTTAALLERAVGILQCSAERLNTAAETCEIKSFCDFLTSKMLSYRPSTRQAVQHAIYKVLVKADRGYFEFPTYTQAPYHQSPVPNFEKIPSRRAARSCSNPQGHPNQQVSQEDISVLESQSVFIPKSLLTTSFGADEHAESSKDHATRSSSPASSSQFSDIDDYV